jgi:hypothetical protein
LVDGASSGRTEGDSIPVESLPDSSIAGSSTGRENSARLSSRGGGPFRAEVEHPDDSRPKDSSIVPPHASRTIRHLGPSCVVMGEFLA